MDLDCVQLSQTVPLPPGRQLATCHTVQAFTSNRGANAPVPTSPAKIFALVQKTKVGGTGGGGQGLRDRSVGRTAQGGLWAKDISGGELAAF